MFTFTLVPVHFLLSNTYTSYTSSDYLLNCQHCIIFCSFHRVFVINMTLNLSVK